MERVVAHAATARCLWSIWLSRAISSLKSASWMTFFYTVDDLGSVVQTGIENRQAAVAQAEAIIENRVRSFMHWMDGRAIVPVIQDLHESSEQLRLAELDRARRMLARGDDAEQVLEALSRGLTAKFLHGPQQALHQASGDDRARLASLLPQLFRTKR
jgi:glutamyl-tRNA reductase